MPGTPVKVGQIWQDNDKRTRNRFLRIEEVHSMDAVVVQVAIGDAVAALPGARRTRIRLDRFKPTATGYRLVQDAAE